MRRNQVLLSRFHFNFVAVLLLGLVFPFAAAGQGTSNGMKLPSIYQDKLDDFLVNNNVMKNSNAKNFTINFVEKEMEADWKISKENQLLFIWHTIYKELTNQDLYDGKDDVQQIAEDFGNKSVITKIRICRQKYRNGYTAYMNQCIAEAQQSYDEAQQSYDEAQQSYDEAIKETMRLDSIGIKQMVEFYDIYTTRPSIVKQEELVFMKESIIEVINQCKKYGIDYRAILFKETGDRKKVNAILKFYEIAD